MIQKMHSGPLGNFGVNFDRFEDSLYADKVPGPGTYDRKDRVGLGRPGAVNAFKSRAKRKVFEP
jgi:hypothetical protein